MSQSIINAHRVRPQDLLMDCNGVSVSDRYGDDVAAAAEESVIPMMTNVMKSWDHIHHLKVGSIAKHTAKSLSRQTVSNDRQPPELAALPVSAIDQPMASFVAVRMGQSAARGISSIFKTWQHFNKLKPGK